MDNGILTLFDIDGTLVRGARCHYMAFVHAVSKFYGMEEDISGINYAGKTDPQILREVLEMGNIPDKTIEENFQACLNYMTDYYLANVHQENVMALGGVKELLGELQKDEVLMGLTTGNLELIAHAKLNRAGIDNYFSFGGFGSDSPKRPCLVKKALERARELHGYQGDQVFVIGDTPRDVEAARPFKLRTIAVATGRYSTQELAETGADFVLESLDDINQVKEIIGIR
ncbi:HAD family hydrolase [Methanobacterium sp.]|uniref:HAD family hydrolase n=1 Tax=Methanobacterium sp. TaxID=2164 RepID=UPI0025DB7794|nr:HAD family hydrolase [Methanobacterium sp.]MBI5459982.1 HAD hydrolase-like protein [Methanobacterium sp.]MDY9924187.1 HAD family hydrolase [Methanobacterium sp.]